MYECVYTQSPAALTHLLGQYAQETLQECADYLLNLAPFFHPHPGPAIERRKCHLLVPSASDTHTHTLKHTHAHHLSQNTQPLPKHST